MSETAVKESETVVTQEPLSADKVISAMFPKDDYSELTKVVPEVSATTEVVKPTDGGDKAPDGSQAPEKTEKETPAPATTEVVDDSDLPEALRTVKKETPTPEASAELLKSEFGIEPGDFNAVATRLKEAKAKSEQYEAIVQDIQRLDPVVQAMLQANLNGEDPHTAYELAMGKRVDFTKPADKQKMETLIASYASDIISVEEYRESKELEVDDKRVLAAEKLALAKFEADQERWVKNQEKYESQKTAKKDNYTKSVELAISTATSSIANPEAKEFKSVVDKIKTQGLVPMFYNGDGTLRSDAVEKAFFAEHGKAFIEDLVKRNQKLTKDLKEKSESLAKTAGLLPEQPPAVPGGGEGGTGDEVPTWVKAIVNQKAD